jgi:RND family efflux transporter MFP subunit
MRPSTIVGTCLAFAVFPGVIGGAGVVRAGSAASDEPRAANAGSVVAPARAKSFDERAAAFGGYTWVTRPNRDAVMAFTFPVEIAQVAVKPGQKVKVGDLLVRARDTEATASLEVQRVRADNDAPVRNAKASLEMAKIRFEAAERAKSGNAMNPQEYDERRLGLAAAEAALANALASQKEEQQKLAQLQEQVQRYRIEARFDGILDMVTAEPGQAVDLQQPIIRLVNIDPLWADVPTPTDETLKLKLTEGSAAWVLLDVPEEMGGAEVMRARVLNVAPVTDAAGSRRVRVEIDNPKQIPAGTRVQVRFTQPSESEMMGGGKPSEKSVPTPEKGVEKPEVEKPVAATPR